MRVYIRMERRHRRAKDEKEILPTLGGMMYSRISLVTWQTCHSSSLLLSVLCKEALKQ
jgi:hypothetical protein